MRTTMTVAAVAAMILSAGVALAGPTAEQKCEAGKNDAAGKYDACAARAEKGRVSSGDMTKYADALVKCEEKLAARWDKLEAAAVDAGTVCPSTDDQVAIENFVDACVQSIAVAVSGGTLGPDPVTCSADLGTCTGDLGTCTSSLGACTGNLGTCNGSLTTCSGDLTTCQAGLSSTNDDLATCNTDLSACQAATCGNNTAEFAETCDGADLHGKSCVTQTPSTPYGTLACNGSCNEFVTSGCKGRFTDNGDGTVTDHSTKLMWEKKTTAVGTAVNYANPHDVDNTYIWTAGTTAPNGTAFTDFLDKLNGQAGAGTGFAGHYDWRLPTLEELQGILDLGAPECGSGSPCIDAVFGPTQLYFYWSSTTYQGPSFAWSVPFDGGGSSVGFKTGGSSVRAVRGGS